jgi:hypothetical protein
MAQVLGIIALCRDAGFMQDPISPSPWLRLQSI